MTEEDKPARDPAFSAAATAVGLALGDHDRPLTEDQRAALSVLTTDELWAVKARLMKDACRRYGVSNISDPLTFVTALKIDGVRGLKRVDKGRTSDEQTAIIQRMLDETAGRAPERGFFAKLFER